jgi:hypothetical protein
MALLSILLAAAASYAFGAIWYMALAKPWMAAADVTDDMIKNGRDGQGSGPMAYVIAFVCAIVVAGMMRHTFAASGIEGAATGLIAGLGIGLFMVAPWIATNYAFSMRPRALVLIDGGYAAIGSAIMGLVLGLF